MEKEITIVDSFRCLFGSYYYKETKLHKNRKVQIILPEKLMNQFIQELIEFGSNKEIWDNIYDGKKVLDFKKLKEYCFTTFNVDLVEGDNNQIIIKFK